MNKVIVITGPTASGKTSVSVELAGKINGEIINCDSMQIYKNCNIGSAKPSEAEKKGIVHHMIDVVEPDENFSTADFKENALSVIDNIIRRGKVPVITGGTGLYIDALVKNIDFAAFVGSPAFRSELKQMLEDKGKDYMYALLRKRDPDAAEKVHVNNSRRVLRYLEILNSTEGTLKEYMDTAVSNPSLYDFRIFILWPDREFIYNRIENRVEEMIAAGLVDEVKNLASSGIQPSSQSMQGIGYKETLSYINGDTDYDEFTEALKRNTRRYAKRQFTWMKRYKDAYFIPVDSNSTKDDICRKILAEF